MSDEGASPLWFAAAVAAGLLVLLVAFLGGLGGTAALPGVSTLGRVALWMPLVQAEAQRYGVPAALELGLIAHESGGDYLATAQDPNGTTDAGLGQINSGPVPTDPHWAEFGLQADPFDPAANVAASVRILAADLAQSGGHVQAALYAYNAGSVAAGLAFDPGYASAVLAASAQVEAGPILVAWPVGGQRLSAGTWRAPATAGPGAAYVVVTAMAPADPPAAGLRPRWLPLLAPSRVTAAVNGGTVGVAPSTTAPRGLQALMPPAAAYWWLVAPVTLAGGTVVTVQATWPAQPKRNDAGSGTSATMPIAPRAVATLNLERG